jgi:hypothetical protein
MTTVPARPALAQQRNQVTKAPLALPSGERDAAEEGDATIPVAFVDPSSELMANDGQAAALNAMRQEFVELMAEGDQDPASPEYRHRWQEAQQRLDQEFMTSFGQEAYNQQLSEAVRKAGESSSGSVIQ